MTIRCVFVLGICAAIGWAAPARASEDYACPDDAKVCRFSDTRLPVRVLIRPASAIYDAGGDDADVIRGNLPPFRPWYVYGAEGVDLSDPENPKGWYQVGYERDGEPFGWVRAGDALLWRSSLVVTYTNRGSGAEEDKRSPVLMFSEIGDVKAMMEASDPGAVSGGLIEAIEAGDLDKARESGVVMMEPKRFVDFKNGFYMLPVVDFEVFSVGLDEQARYLQLAAAVPQTDEDIGRGATAVTNEDARTNAVATEADGQMVAASELGIDIKFVIDMTGSMQPYLDATRDAVGRILNRVAERGLPDDAVSYGLVGYTDEPGQCRDCAFPYARNFTPEPVSGEEIVRLLSSDPAARASGGGDWPETVYAGLREAVQSNWRDNALPIVVAIGDALSKDLGGDGNRLTAESARSLADNAAGERSVTVISMHARPAEAGASANRTAEEQFRAIARNPGTQSDSYIGFDVSMSDARGIENAFATAVQEAGDTLVAIVERVRGGDTSSLAEERAPAPEGDVGAVVEEAVNAALVQYLGAEAVRPNDLTAWAVDVDPVNTFVQSLDVRVLMEKRDLADLVKTMESLLEQYRKAEMLGTDFFEELQAAGVGGILDEGATERDAATLAGSGLSRSFIASLPYRSALLELTPETFANMTADDREFFEADLEDKIFILTDYLNDPDVWTKLSPDVGELSAVFPVPLSDLP